MKCMRSGAPRTWSASRGKTPKPNESRESFERSSRVSFTSRSAGTSVPTGSACRSESLAGAEDRKSTRLNSSHSQISYAVFCLKKKTVLVYIHEISTLWVFRRIRLERPTARETVSSFVLNDHIGPFDVKE